MVGILHNNNVFVLACCLFSFFRQQWEKGVVGFGFPVCFPCVRDNFEFRFRLLSIFCLSHFAAAFVILVLQKGGKSLCR